MQISTKTGYAVRALSMLAKQPTDEPLSLTVLCRDQNLPQKYIEQLFRKLKQKDLVKSIHGSKGGYLINKKTSDITLKDIMAALDDDFPAECCYGSSGYPEYCSGDPCAFSSFWDDIKKNIENYLDSITLEQIVARI
jgi:Rrf2 family protein